MGIFSKIKNKLGIGGVKVELQVPSQVSIDSREIEGKLILTTKSEQEITDTKIKLVEEFTTGRGDNKETKEYDLGITKLATAFKIKPGEIKEIPFKLTFELIKSNADSLKEKGGALGALGKMSKFANKEKSSYYINADVDVKSAVLDPSDRKDIKLI